MKVYIKTILIISFIFIFRSLFGQIGDIPKEFCINQKEYRLYQLINDYRSKLTLDDIPLSKSLCFVAKTHAADLSANFKRGGECNMYSWSDKGDWKPFCYPADQNKRNDIKDKAKELIGYPGKAWELTYWDNVDVSLNDVVSFWNSIAYTNSIISNSDNFTNKKWNSMGVGIQDGYILVWFGDQEDSEAFTTLCETGEKIYNKSIPNELVVPSTVSSTNETNGKFYIVIGSYNRKSDAEAAVKSYKEMGYPNSVVIEEQGKIRIAIDYFTSKTDADNALNNYRKKFKGAWVFSK